MEESAPPEVAMMDGRPVLRLRCNFAGTAIERASWDRKVELNLAECQGVQFQLFCRDASPVSHFSLYFQSGEGWYRGTFFPALPGWNTITVDKSTMGTGGHPAGWGQIQTIRLSAWGGSDTDTELYLKDLRLIGVLGEDALVAVVQADSAAESRPEEMRSVEEYAEAAQRLLEAYCTAQKPLPGEFRAFWCHSAFGVAGMSWDTAIQRLADNGFQAILPNMLWGGVTYYDSKVLPVSPEVATQGDQIAQCVAAGKKHGVQVHVWKVNHIRYPDGDHCFCTGCRERFQKATGGAVRDFPRDVLPGGALRQLWLEWHRSNITAVVKAASERARAVKPTIQLSAAVFCNWSVDRDTVG